jgi:hypothetical protein
MTVPPSVSTGSDAMISPVLCIIGEAGSATGGGYTARSWRARSIDGALQSRSVMPRLRRASTSVLFTELPTTYSTPFGSPVVPPVNDRKTSLLGRSIRGAGSWPAISAS